MLAMGVRKQLASGGAEAIGFRTPPKICIMLPISGKMVHKIGTNFWNGDAKKMNDASAPPEPAALGTPVKYRPGAWVQTERKAHEAWARFCLRKPTASAVLHQLVACMGPQNAVIIPQKVLGQLLGMSDRTVRTAIADLAAERWIQVVRLGKGKEAAYVVNDRVAWGQPRDQLRLSVFSASVIADMADQDPISLETTELRRIPVIYPGERQLPTGPAEDPDRSIADEPDLPALRKKIEPKAND